MINRILRRRSMVLLATIGVAASVTLVGSSTGAAASLPVPRSMPARPLGAAKPAAVARPVAVVAQVPSPVRPKCGGRLTFGDVANCTSITGTHPDVFTVVTTVDGDSLFTMLRDSAGSGGGFVSGGITNSAGVLVCSVPARASRCRLGAAGRYTVTLRLISGASGQYSLSVESAATPSNCSTLPDAFFSFASPGLSDTTQLGVAAQCINLDQPQGSVLYLQDPGAPNVQAPILDGQNQPICQVGDATTCALRTPGPYHLFLYDINGDASAYELRMPRISAPAGCGAVAVGSFGDQGSAVGSGTVSPQSAACHVLTASAAGPAFIRVKRDQDVSWTLYTDAGQQVCEAGFTDAPCTLPAAGQYTLLVTSGDIFADTSTYRVGVTSLADAAGCASPSGTSWDLPALFVHQTSDLQVNCQPFHGQAGDRILTYASGAYNSIVDDGGTLLCGPGFDQQDGCVLPATGGYRVITYLWNGTGGSPDVTYKLQVRRLSSAEGCPTVAPGSYNAPPASPLAGIRCRTLDIATAGSYLIYTSDAQNNLTSEYVLYDASGTSVCDFFAECDIPRAGQYTMVLGARDNSDLIDNDFSYALALLPFAPSGCPEVGDDPTLMTPYRGEFTNVGEHDCVRLASPAGAAILELHPHDATSATGPTVTVVDSTGAQVCDSFNLHSVYCQLTGTAPFYAVYSLPAGVATGAYALTFPRVSGDTGCPVLPRTADGTTVSTSAGKFVACFSVPADQHATKETFAFHRTSGSGQAGMAVLNVDGVDYCNALLTAADDLTTTCTLPAGPVTVLLETDAVDATYQLSHSDATPPGGVPLGGTRAS
jgi:hypothetical protein